MSHLPTPWGDCTLTPSQAVLRHTPRGTGLNPPRVPSWGRRPRGCASAGRKWSPSSLRKAGGGGGMEHWSCHSQLPSGCSRRFPHTRRQRLPCNYLSLHTNDRAVTITLPITRKLLPLFGEMALGKARSSPQKGGFQCDQPSVASQGKVTELEVSGAGRVSTETLRRTEAENRQRGHFRSPWHCSHPFLDALATQGRSNHTFVPVKEPGEEASEITPAPHMLHPGLDSEVSTPALECSFSALVNTPFCRNPIWSPYYGKGNTRPQLRGPDAALMREQVSRSNPPGGQLA